MSKNSAIIKNYILKRNELLNYAENICKHNYSELFPEDEYNFKNSNYKSYLYLGKEESRAILQDYFLLLKTAYGDVNIFSYEHFFSIVKEFMEHLEAENVFFAYKTYYGHKLLNNNINGFVNECEKLLELKLKSKTSNRLNVFEFEKSLELKNEFNFKFFEFLTRKILGTITTDDFVLEPILLEDCKKIQSAYLQAEQVENPPFYMDVNSKYYKYIRPKVSDYVLCLLPKEKAWSVVNSSMREVAILVLSPEEGNEVSLNIISDCDYMDSKLSQVLEVMKDYAVQSMNAVKIVGLNNNESIGYSNVATAYSLAKFLPNYESAVGENGLTRLKYTFNLEGYDPAPSKATLPLEPISYATFSIYLKR